jgi:hypothetical protein
VTTPPPCLSMVLRSLYFMGGKKEEAKAKIARDAAGHESDLIFLASVYTDWRDAGRAGGEGGNKCATCGRPAGRNGCRACRVAMCKARGLNNKCLDAVDTMVRSITETLGREKARAGERSANVLEAVGHCLLQAFPEQVRREITHSRFPRGYGNGSLSPDGCCLMSDNDLVVPQAFMGGPIVSSYVTPLCGPPPPQVGHVLMPSSPGDGVRLLGLDVRASIAATSTFLGGHGQFFVATKITCLPSGETLGPSPGFGVCMKHQRRVHPVPSRCCPVHEAPT